MGKLTIIYKVLFKDGLDTYNRGFMTDVLLHGKKVAKVTGYWDITEIELDDGSIYMKR
jgi:hypothetical protein